MDKDSKITIFCDGACRGNGREHNLGAWGAILEFQGNEKEIGNLEVDTTNNVMELKACIEALKVIKKKNIPVEVISDSQYLVQGITTWLPGWVNNGWRTSTDKPVKNVELWKELYDLCLEFKSIQFFHVKGHDKCEGNLRVDDMLNRMMDQYYQLVYNV